MIDSSRRPVIAICSVRGIGVAVSVSTCTSAFSAFSRSLWTTPKRCSSSTITRPSRLNSTPLARSAWVPTTMSTVPSARPSRVALASAAGPGATGAHLHRASRQTARGNSGNAGGPAGGRADHRHLHARHRRTKAARSATSVLPKPTSPHTSRSIGLPGAPDPPARRRSRAPGRRFPHRGSGRRRRP
jgi:hypothetical protein